ncbi:MAG: SBBP repeat-containing protein, partial [Nocardioidaceae bacterium]
TGYTTSGPNPHPANEDPLDPATDPAPYFPTTAGAFDTTYGGRASTDSGSTLFLDGDAFVFVMHDSGSGPVWSTFVGGPAADYGQGIALDSAGEVYITGWTTCREQDNRATEGANEAPPQFELFDDDNDPDTPDVLIPTGRAPGDPDETGVGDCDGLNPYGSDSVPAGTFPQVNPIVDPGRGLDESAMAATFLGFELHNSPTGVFVTNLKADGSAVDYSLVLDGPGFDRGFAIAVRDRNSQNRSITPEAYVTGRTGRQGYPVVASTAAGATLYDGTYNGAGRDTFISKLVG